MGRPDFIFDLKVDAYRRKIAAQRSADMARVRMFGATFNADPIKDNGDGTWQMRSRAHTGRTAPGTVITVKQSEIEEMAAAEAPAGTNAPGLAALEFGMAAERKTIPTPQELIAQHRAAATAKTDPPAGRPLYSKPGVTVPPGPTSRP